MTDTFNVALPILLREEGGFVNDPHDPGGMTNLGVTRDTWQHWVGHYPSDAEMHALTPALVAPLYRAHYWNAVHGDSLPVGLALCVFDFGVNAGPGRASEYLQKVVGAPVDGSIGPQTLAYVNQAVAHRGLPAVIRAYMQSRREYYETRKNFPRYGKGWLARVDRVEDAALNLR